MPRLRLRFALWRAGDGWRWRLRAANGEKIGAATESYTTRANAWENARTVIGAHRVPDVSAMQDVGGGRFFALIADDRDDE